MENLKKICVSLLMAFFGSAISAPSAGALALDEAVVTVDLDRWDGLDVPKEESVPLGPSMPDKISFADILCIQEFLASVVRGERRLEGMENASELAFLILSKGLPYLFVRNPETGNIIYTPLGKALIEDDIESYPRALSALNSVSKFFLGECLEQKIKFGALHGVTEDILLFCRATGLQLEGKYGPQRPPEGKPMGDYRGRRALYEIKKIQDRIQNVRSCMEEAQESAETPEYVVPLVQETIGEVTAELTELKKTMKSPKKVRPSGNRGFKGLFTGRA